MAGFLNEHVSKLRNFDLDMRASGGRLLLEGFFRPASRENPPENRYYSRYYPNCCGGPLFPFRFLFFDFLYSSPSISKRPAAVSHTFRQKNLYPNTSVGPPSITRTSRLQACHKAPLARHEPKEAIEYPDCHNQLDLPKAAPYLRLESNHHSFNMAAVCDVLVSHLSKFSHQTRFHHWGKSLPHEGTGRNVVAIGRREAWQQGSPKGNRQSWPGSTRMNYREGANRSRRKTRPFGHETSQNKNTSS